MPKRRVQAQLPQSPDGPGTETVHSEGPRPPAFHPVKGCFLPLQMAPGDRPGTSTSDQGPAPWPPGPQGSGRPTRILAGWPGAQPLSAPGLDSQIPEVCGPTEGLPGDSLDGVLTQVPVRIKPKEENAGQERLLQRAREARQVDSRTSHSGIAGPMTAPGTQRPSGSIC